MVHYERYVYNHEIITAILDQCPVCYLGLQDKKNPYVVPVNYGYIASEDHLSIIIHSGRTGYKLRLLDQPDQIVCCTFAMWKNFPETPYKGHFHDFRSVMAFGKARRLDFESNKKEMQEAMKELFRANNRTRCVDPNGLKHIFMYAIECDWENVSGKTETPVRTASDVSFVENVNMPDADIPYDWSDLLDTQPQKIQNRKALGYLRDDE